MSKIIYLIFRKDLSLSQYWWHRLISVVFVIVNISIFAFFLGIGSFNRYKVVDKLENRITPTLEEIANIRLDSGEFLSDYEDGAPRGSYVQSYTNGTYCSTKLADNFEKILEKVHIQKLHFREKTFDKNYSQEEYKKLISEQGIKCLVVDSYTNPNGSVNYYFLDVFIYLNDFRVAKFNYLTSVFSALLFVVSQLFISWLVYFTFLYIIFGFKNSRV